MTQPLVIFPENYDFIKKHAPVPAKLPEAWSIPLIGAIIALYLFIIGILIIATIELNKENVLFQQSTVTTATLTGRDARRTTSKTWDYSLSYLYIVDGEVYTDTQSVNRSMYNDYQHGDKIQILYALHDPSRTRIVGVHSDYSILLLAGFTVIMIALGGYSIYALFKKRREVRTLNENGRLIVGTIVDVHGWTHKHIYRLKMTVLFKTPDTSETIQATKTYVVRPQLFMPEAGKSIAIYYYDKHLWEVL